MKNRWIGGLALVIVFALGACAPTRQGVDESATDATVPAVTVEPSVSAEPGVSAEPSASAEPTPDDYEY